jgi:hypothetical protein
MFWLSAPCKLCLKLLISPKKRVALIPRWLVPEYTSQLYTLAFYASSCIASRVELRSRTNLKARALSLIRHITATSEINVCISITNVFEFTSGFTSCKRLALLVMLMTIFFTRLWNVSLSSMALFSIWFFQKNVELSSDTDESGPSNYLSPRDVKKLMLCFLDWYTCTSI